MTTTITREERERVAKLWFADWAAEIIARDGIVPSDFSKEISIADIDRVAQALRDAEGDVLRTIANLLGGGSMAPTIADIMEIVRFHKDRAFAEGAITAAKNLSQRDAAPQWREVTETEPAKDIDVLIRERDGHCEVGWVSRKGLWMTVGGRPVKPAPTHWMPLPAPPEVKPAPAPAPQPIAQPGASEAARIEALERTVTELALAVERLSGGAK